VANELGRTYVEQAVSSWRCGSSMPPANVLFALARQLNLSLDRFMLSRPTLDELLTALETQMADFTQPGDRARARRSERGGAARQDRQAALSQTGRQDGYQPAQALRRAG
jgi:transcriptional regulator with XRE-family HTH domain